MSNIGGYCIAIDGPDGVGKTTQIQLLHEWLESNNRSVLLTRMSGGSPIGDKLRKVSLLNIERPGETDFHISLAMAEASKETIRKAKSSGSVVVIDRSPLAFLAYNAYGSKIADKNPVIKATLDYINIMSIDLLLYLNAPEKQVIERLKLRTDKPNDYFESQSNEYRQRVREGYEHGLRLAKQSTRVLEVDASPPVNTVQSAIRGALKQYLALN